MKVLVTGAAGFIGSNLSDYLLGKGFEVVGIDNFNDYYNPSIKEYNIKDFKDDKKFTLYRDDILDTDALENLFSTEKPDAIVHLAAWAGVTPSIKLPNIYVKNNIEGTVNLAECAVKHGTENFIFASTSSIYGDVKGPFVEEMNTDRPLAPYPATKKACEVMLSTYNRNFGLNVTIFRIFNPLGKRLRPDLALPRLVKSCLYGYEFPLYWTDPSSTGRDYTYLLHLLEASEYVINNPFKYEIFNIGNSAPVTLDVLIQTVEKVVGKKANTVTKPARQGEMLTTFADITKAKKMIEYTPATSLKETVEIYYNWFRDQEEWYQKIEDLN